MSQFIKVGLKGNKVLLIGNLNFNHNTTYSWHQHFLRFAVILFLAMNDKAVECCNEKGANAVEELSPLCLPIVIPPDDPRMPNRGCINFVRSVLAPRNDCGLGDESISEQVWNI